MTQVRLQKLLAEAGICSRREAEQLILAGEVKVNGKISKVGDKADIEEDSIKVMGKLLRQPAERVVVALYKPRDVICSTKPPSRDDGFSHPSIYELIPRIRERVFPIGKLDTDAEGILLLTNDGALSRRLNDAKYEVPKKWSLKIDGHIEEKKLKFLEKGFKLEGRRLKIQRAEITEKLDGKVWVVIECTEVQNRVLRQAIEKLGHPVDKIQRMSFGGIDIRDMKRGQYRYLMPDEVNKLREWVGLTGATSKEK